MENESPSIRKIHEAVSTLIENGHGNVPALLRRIARDIEESPPVSGKVIIFPGPKLKQ